MPRERLRGQPDGRNASRVGLGAAEAMSAASHEDTQLAKAQVAEAYPVARAIWKA